MLADILSRYKSSLSLTFAIIFSLVNLISQTSFIGTSANKAAAFLDFFTGTFHSIGQGVVRLVDSYGSYSELQKERDALAEQLRLTRESYLQIEHLKGENLRLRNASDLPIHKSYDTITAEVISVNPDNWFKTIIINKGSDHGVRPYMPVIAFQAVSLPENNSDSNSNVQENGERQSNIVKDKLIIGVIGKVIQVTSSSARILPITDQHSRLGVKVQKSGYWGMLSGQSHHRELPKLEYISLKTTLGPGDVIVTSGESGLYPAGLTIGKISGEPIRGATFQEAYIEPVIDMRKLDLVFIIRSTPKRKNRKFPKLASKETQQTIRKIIEGPDVKPDSEPVKNEQ